VQINRYNTPDQDRSCSFSHDEIEPTPENMWDLAEDLDNSARSLRARVHEMTDNDEHKLIVSVKVFANNRAQVWVNDDVATAEQIRWIEERLDDALTLINEMADNVTDEVEDGDHPG